MLNGVFVFLFGGKTEPIEGRGVPFVLIYLWGYPSVHQPKGFQDIYVKADWAPAKPKWSLQVTLFRTVFLFLFFLLKEADQRSTKATSLSIHQISISQNSLENKLCMMNPIRCISTEHLGPAPRQSTPCQLPSARQCGSLSDENRQLPEKCWLLHHHLLLHHHHHHHPDPDEFTVRLLKSNQQIPKKFTLQEFPPCWLDRIHLLGSSKHCHDMTSTVNNCQCNPRIYSLVIKHDNGSQPCSSTGWVVIMYSMIVVIYAPLLSHHCPMIIPSLSHDRPMFIPCLSHDYPIIIPWLSHVYPMIIPSSSQVYPMIIQWLQANHDPNNPKNLGVISWHLHGLAVRLKVEESELSALGHGAS